ncbi:MAG: transposase [Oscillospiraceae bacterium]|nr:transposase [Oscillospiraceae bacterium]MBO5918839.1 transposase [Oscillospiraceae bacterium]
MEQPKRKLLRLKEYDYSQNGAYFVTICTKDRAPVFGHIVGGGLRAAPYVELTSIGAAVEQAILTIPEINPGVECEIYCIMPDHVHLMVVLTGRHGGRPLPEVIKRFKSYTDHLYREISGAPLWQRGYYDHVIRNQQDFDAAAEYIQTNPTRRWERQTGIP